MPKKKPLTLLESKITKAMKEKLEKLEMARTIQDLQDKLAQSLKLSEEALITAQAAHKATQPKVAPKPNLIVEDFPDMTKEQLLLKLAEEIIASWTESTFKGNNSRQAKVFNKLNSGIVQELFKEILSRK
jgi:cysteine sulfinate desulfinase/cysteine desulfurase-like protein